MWEPSGKYKVGDWVRFMRAGRLKVGVIAYRQKGYTEPLLLTDQGTVPEGDVLEVRRAEEKPLAPEKPKV